MTEREMIEFLIDVINQGTKKFDYEEAPFLHDAMGKYFEWSTGISLEDLLMTDKQIIKKFSDNHCLVLENNQISLRENEFTAYRIVLGKSTNELLEFVKDTYLQLKAKEQECDGLTTDTVYLRDRVGKLERAILRRNEQLDQLKTENEQLKKECEILKNQVLTLDDETITVQITQQQFEEYNQLKEDNDTLRQFLSKEPLALQALQSGYASYKKSSDVFYEMVKQYKQTLAEIKDIAENHKATSHCDYLTDMDNILQKISEVQND